MASVEGVNRDEREELQNPNNPGKEANSVRTWEIFVRISSSILSINVPVLPSLPLPCINNLNGLFLFFHLGPVRLSSSVTPEAVSVRGTE